MKSIFAIIKLAGFFFLIYLGFKIIGYFSGPAVTSTTTTTNTVSLETKLKHGIDSMKTVEGKYPMLEIDLPISGESTSKIETGLWSYCPAIKIQGNVVCYTQYSYSVQEVWGGLESIGSINKSEAEYNLKLGVPKVSVSKPLYNGTNAQRETGITQWFAETCQGSEATKKAMDSLIINLAKQDSTSAYDKMYDMMSIDPATRQKIGEKVFTYLTPLFTKQGVNVVLNITFDTQYNSPYKALEDFEQKTYKVIVTNRNGTTEVIPQ